MSDLQPVLPALVSTADRSALSGAMKCKNDAPTSIVTLSPCLRKDRSSRRKQWLFRRVSMGPIYDLDPFALVHHRTGHAV
mmetsp:Transcript_8142/g.19083  ORF Transcript_8142/g.19083 Transcript_8142/m.19083 type:complete len:80 (-) Transcript_8142:950-1189(-)